MSGYLQGRGIHVDQHLTQIALNYTPQGFIADRIAPIVGVNKQSGIIKTYNQADLFRVDNDKRSPGTEANKVSYQVGSTAYYAKNYALAADVTIEDRANADPAFIMDLEEGRVLNVMNKLKLSWEQRISNLCTTTTNVGTATGVASAWTDYTNSNPVKDCWTMIDNIKYATGYRPNKVVFGDKAWELFSRNNNVINKVNATALAGAALNASEQQAAALLQVDEVLVGRAFYNSAEEGVAGVITPLWGSKVLLAYAPSRPSIEVPSFMYSFRWSGNGLANMTVERHPFDPKEKCDTIEVGYYQDEAIVAKPLAGLLVAVDSST